jgi:hypothetical protein
MKAPLLAATSLAFSMAFSQTDTSWSKVLRLPDNHITSSFSIPLAQNKILTGGKTGNGYGMVVLQDSAGNLLNAHLVCSAGTPSTHNVMKAAAPTADGGAIVAGNAYNADSAATNGIILRLDQNGDTLWTKTFSASSMFGGIDLSGAVVTASGDFAVAGTLGSQAAPFIVRISPNGSTIWAGNIHGISAATVTGFAEHADGDFWIAGALTNPQSASYVARLSADGLSAVANQFPDILVQEIAPRASGLLVQALDPTTMRAAIIKLDEGCAILHSYAISENVSLTYGQNARMGMKSDTLFAMIYGDQFVTNVFVVNFEEATIALYQPELNGVDVFFRDSALLITGYGPTYGIKSDDGWNDMIGVISYVPGDEDEVCVPVSGEATLLELNVTSAFAIPQPAILTVPETEQSLLYEAIDLSVTDECVYRWGDLKEQDAHELIVYPNASAGVFRFSAATAVPFSIFVSNAEGKEVAVLTAVSGEGTIDLSEKPAGMYFFKALFDDSTATNGRLIVIN